MSGKLVILDETDDGYGYVISEQKYDILVSFWANENKTIKVKYSSLEHLYKSAKVFLECGLTKYSQNHIAQVKMYEAFIEWFEDK
jgi:hypothetical protein